VRRGKLLLDIVDLRVRYGSVIALAGIDLAVEEGEFVAVVGANGAGKTTLLRTLSGLERADRGAVLFDTEDITGLGAAGRVERGLIQVPEGRELFGAMTVTENLQLGANGGRGDGEIGDDDWDLFPRLRERRRQRADSMSGGEQQMLALARGLLSRPRMLLLDEPSLGLAPVIVRQIMVLLERLHSEGMTILLVEQNANMALSISDRAYVLENGKVSSSGSSRDLIEDDEVRRAYLGVGA
jgi:branched-chain amino acid transport system ATP-binding protein